MKRLGARNLCAPRRRNGRSRRARGSSPVRDRLGRARDPVFMSAPRHDQGARELDRLGCSSSNSLSSAAFSQRAFPARARSTAGRARLLQLPVDARLVDEPVRNAERQRVGLSPLSASQHQRARRSRRRARSPRRHDQLRARRVPEQFLVHRLYELASITPADLRCRSIRSPRASPPAPSCRPRGASRLGRRSTAPTRRSRTPCDSIRAHVCRAGSGRHRRRARRSTHEPLQTLASRGAATTMFGHREYFRSHARCVAPSRRRAPRGR